MDDAAWSGGIVEVGGCRSAPLSEQRGERESERGGRRSTCEEEEMEGGGRGGTRPTAGPGHGGGESHGVGGNRGADTKTGEGRR
jgi:hypothetical protein